MAKRRDRDHAMTLTAPLSDAWRNHHRSRFLPDHPDFSNQNSGKIFWLF
jgi:hypothetical protein